MKVNISSNATNTKTLFTLLKEQGIILPHSCNEKGTCGQCAVMTNHNGWQLACSYIPTENITVEISDKESQSEISNIPTKHSISAISHFTRQQKSISEPILLIDLGTTTIAMVLLREDGSVSHQVTFANPNKDYGTDVIARMKSSNEGYRLKMQEQLTEEFKKQWTKFPDKSINACYIAGNTVMVHLLMGYSCEELSVYPFTPHTLKEIQLTYHSCPVYIFPAISSFIGGDITSGLFSLYFENREDTCLFLDLGTNGELALLREGHITVASVAAGPAFEGGNLSCGCQGIPGAITDVTLGGLRPRLTTIGNKLPVGLCGTGALSITEELLKKKYVTKEGIITDSFPEDGILLGKSVAGANLLFTRDDFRQVQLALASVKAGIHTLLAENSLSYQNINHIYIAGGFGYALSLDTACALGIIPPECKTITESIGNSSLSGLERYALDGNLSLKILISKTTELSLAENSFFKEELIRCMTFR